MKTATGLALLAIGAILAFAVRASPPGISIHAVGWILILTGVAGFLVPGRAAAWARRTVVRPPAAGPGRRPGPGRPAEPEDEHLPYPPYVLRDPAALASAILRDAELADLAHGNSTGNGYPSGHPGQPGADGTDSGTGRPLLRAVTDDDVARRR
jgi:Domain of unknown function (DUF6458)